MNAAAEPMLIIYGSSDRLRRSYHVLQDYSTSYPGFRYRIRNRSVSIAWRLQS